VIASFGIEADEFGLEKTIRLICEKYNPFTYRDREVIKTSNRLQLGLARSFLPLRLYDRRRRWRCA
jgi:hypothetical protein